MSIKAGVLVVQFWEHPEIASHAQTQIRHMTTIYNPPLRRFPPTYATVNRDSHPSMLAILEMVSAKVVMIVVYTPWHSLLSMLGDKQ